MENQFDVEGLRNVVERHWKYHRVCRHRLWSIELVENGVTKLEAAPVFQEVLGGVNDGKRVWTAFEMNLSELSSEPGLEITEFGFRSFCIECTQLPFVGIRGTFQELPFTLILHLEPIPNSEPVEVIDSINHEVRAIQKDQ